MKNPSPSISPSAQVGHAWRSALWATLLATTLLLVAVSCKKEAATKPPDVDYYTCTMHPSVKKQGPNDKCPICSMDLEAVKKRKTSAQADEKTDGKSMDMSAEEHAKMLEGKGKDGMKGMDSKGKGETKDAKGSFSVNVKQ